MGQFMGVLALLLSETPILHLNVTRYIIALSQAIDSLQPTDPAVLSINIIAICITIRKMKFYFSSTSKCYQ